MWIKSYVSTIILVVLLSLIAESVMPDTAMKKHVSLISGLVILLAIARPIISIPSILVENTRFDFIDDSFILDESSLSEKIVNIRDSAVQSGFKSTLNDLISQDLYKNFRLKVKTEIFENGEDVYLKIYDKEISDVRKHIENTYGIRCIFTGTVRKDE